MPPPEKVNSYCLVVERIDDAKTLNFLINIGESGWALNSTLS